MENLDLYYYILIERISKWITKNETLYRSSHNGLFYYCDTAPVTVVRFNYE